MLVDKSEIVSDILFSSALGASDHLSYSAYLICNPEMRDSNTMKYNLHKGDYASFSEELQTADWSQLQELNAQESLDFFQDKLQKSIEKHIPGKKK